MLIAGSAPTLDSDLVPQPQRHRRVLNELRAAAAEGRRAASAAKAAGDERLVMLVPAWALQMPTAAVIWRLRNVDVIA